MKKRTHERFEGSNPFMFLTLSCFQPTLSQTFHVLCLCPPTVLKISLDMLCSPFAPIFFKYHPANFMGLRKSLIYPRSRNPFLSMSPDIRVLKKSISPECALTAVWNCSKAKFRNILLFADFGSDLLHQNCLSVHNIKSRRSAFPRFWRYYDIMTSLNFHSREIIDMTEELFAELYFIEHRNIPSL